MKRALILLATLLATLIATACGTAQTEGDETTAWVVRPDGVGPVRVGTTLADASRALGEELRVAYEVSEDCDHVRPSALPGDAWLMVVQDTVVRVEVRDTVLATAEGAMVGTAEADLLRLYAGRVRVTPHKYSGPEWHYVIADAAPGDTTHAIVFETDGERVREYRAGRRPEVEWIEGCS